MSIIWNNELDAKPTEPVEAAVVPTAEPEPVIMKVANCEKVNLREKPNAQAKVLDVIVKDTEVIVLENLGEYYEVSLENGVTGYIKSNFLE